MGEGCPTGVPQTSNKKKEEKEKKILRQKNSFSGGGNLKGRSQKEGAKKILATLWGYSRCADLSRCVLYREFTVYDI